MPCPKPSKTVKVLDRVSDALRGAVLREVPYRKTKDRFCPILLFSYQLIGGSTHVIYKGKLVKMMSQSENDFCFAIGKCQLYVSRSRRQKGLAMISFGKLGTWQAAILGAFGILASHFLCVPELQAQPQDSHSGIRLQTAEIDAVGYVWTRIPQDFQLILKAPTNFSLSHLSQNAECNGVAFTGGFSHANPFRSDGLVVVDGKRISAASSRETGGVLSIEPNSVSLLRTRIWRDGSDESHSKLQSHPILIFDGDIDYPLADERLANRVALGLTKGAQLFVIMAFDNDPEGLSAVKLVAFAQVAKRLLEDDIEWLLNLDGGPSAFIHTAERTYSPSAGGISSYFCAQFSE